MLKVIATAAIALTSLSVIAAEPAKDTQRCDVVADYIRQAVDHPNYKRADMYTLVESIANKKSNLRANYVTDAAAFLNSTKLLPEEGYTAEEISALFKNTCKGNDVTAVNR